MELGPESVAASGLIQGPYSRNVVEDKFCELRSVGLASFLPRRLVSAPVTKALSHTPPAAYPARTSLK